MTSSVKANCYLKYYLRPQSPIDSFSFLFCLVVSLQGGKVRLTVLISPSHCSPQAPFWNVIFKICSISQRLSSEGRELFVKYLYLVSNHIRADFMHVQFIYKVIFLKINYIN